MTAPEPTRTHISARWFDAATEANERIAALAVTTGEGE